MQPYDPIHQNYGRAYPKIGSWGITSKSNVSPELYTYFQVDKFGMQIQSPLEIVFKFNKYREVKPYVPVLDSFDFEGYSYKSPSAPTPNVSNALYTIKLYLSQEDYFIRGSQASFYSTDIRSNTLGIYYRVKFSTAIEYCTLAEIETMLNLGSANPASTPVDMSDLPYVTLTVDFSTLEGVKTGSSTRCFAWPKIEL